MSLELANMTVEKNFIQREILNMLWKRQAEGLGDDGGFIYLRRRNQRLLEVCRTEPAVFLVVEKPMSKSCRAAKLMLGLVRKDFAATYFFLMDRSFDSDLPEGLIVHRALMENKMYPLLFIINAGILTVFRNQFSKSKMFNFIAGSIKVNDRDTPLVNPLQIS